MMLDHVRTGAVALLFVAAGGAPLAAADFLRGDFNDDGKTSLADAHKIISFFFRGGTPSDCMNAADVNDDGERDLSDAVYLLQHLVSKIGPPAAPFPAAGPDPTANEDTQLDCDAYGGGSPLADPEAKLEILDAVAAGGAEGTATITVRYSSSLVLAGLSGSMEVDTGIVGTTLGRPAALVPVEGTVHADAKVANGSLAFWFLNTFVAPGPWLSPGTDVDVLEIQVCLLNGAPAGTYPLTLAAGELVEVDSGRAVLPLLVSGELTVLEDLTPDAGCPPGSNCIGPPVVRPDLVGELNAKFEIAGVTAAPGATVSLPFLISANAEVQGYSFSVDFDEEVLTPVRIDKVFDKAPGDAGFEKLDFNARNDVPGSGGIDEGFFVGAMVFSLLDACHNMPANRDNVALRFVLEVRPDAQAASTEVSFLDGGKGAGQPIKNVITAHGTAVTPELANSFVFVNGRVNVVPDIATFLRGDADANGELDLSDAQRTLAYLFLGSEPPACFDAADVDDDGELLISDPIVLLTFLYLGGAAPPSPYPDAGEDPTADAMGCLFRS